MIASCDDLVGTRRRRAYTSDRVAFCCSRNILSSSISVSCVAACFAVVCISLFLVAPLFDQPFLLAVAAEDASGSDISSLTSQGETILSFSEEAFTDSHGTFYKPAPMDKTPPVKTGDSPIFFGPYNTKANSVKTINLPPRKVCEKGWYDLNLEACVYLDRKDKVLPEFTCPKGSVLHENYCYGRILSDYELDCPKNYDANMEALCVKAVVYSPQRVTCPEGFKVKAFGSSRMKQCVQTKYMTPVMRPIQTESAAIPLGCQRGDPYCPKPVRPTADKNWILECPEGRLVELKDTKKTVCLVKVIVPPEPRETCKSGYSWTVLSAGAACFKLSVLDAAKLCPGPTPKLGPGFGDWDTPDYKYDPVDRCVAYKAKAVGGRCPFGYDLEKEFCYRKILLPFYMDCNNLEGYGFRWNAEENSGECFFEYDTFKWSAGSPYLTKREKFDSARVQLFSNPYEAVRAFEKSQVSARINALSS